MDEREEEKIFLHQLQQFWESKGVPNIKIPQIGGKELDVYRLYKTVTKRGGSQLVTNNKQWKEIVNEFGLPSTCTSASFTLRNHYQKLLLAYEQKYFFGKDDGQIYVDTDLPQGRKKMKYDEEENRYMQHQMMEPEQLYQQHEYSEHQLSTLLSQYYSKFPDKNEQVSFIKKQKIFPNKGEMKRILLAFESRLNDELTYAVNNLLLFSVNLAQTFLLEQYPMLLDTVTAYLQDSLANVPSLSHLNLFVVPTVTIPHQQLENLDGYVPKKNIHAQKRLAKLANVLDNYNYHPSHFQPHALALLHSRKYIQLIDNTYDKTSEAKLLERLRSIFTVLRNLALIRSNEQVFLKNDRLQNILIMIYIHNSDTELARLSLEILSILSKHYQLRLLNHSQDFLKRTFELLNSESSEEIELSVEIMRNLISIPDNESILENHQNEYLDFLAKLLVYQNQDVREGVLEFFCYLSDLKMSTRLSIAKHPKILLRIVALLSSGPFKPVNERTGADKINEKNIKLAAITLNNISQAPASKQFLSIFETDIFIVASSDETVTPLLSQILHDLTLMD